MFQGGRHTDYVADQIVSKLIEVVKKKNKAGVAVKPFQVNPDYEQTFYNSKIMAHWLTWLNSVCSGEESHVVVCELSD